MRHNVNELLAFDICVKDKTPNYHIDLLLKKKANNYQVIFCRLSMQFIYYIINKYMRDFI